MKVHILIIVENLPCPFDRRVWQEAHALAENGFDVSIICPKGRGYESSFEVLDGISIYRHALPLEADSALGYLMEYSVALAMEFWLSVRIFRKCRFHVIHACNPPDTIFLIGRFYKFFGVKFLFDHHDINPELYEAKFGRRNFWYWLVSWLEYWTFKTADVSIATNESYKAIAVERGKMDPARVFVVRSGPDLRRVKQYPRDPSIRRGRRFLVAYVGVIGKQEGVDLLVESVKYFREVLERDDTHFLVMGDGTELPSVRRLARKYQLDDYLEFTGRVTENKLWTALSSADVCVNPDRANAMNDKSTMNKIMEYMAVGKPIVQFDLTEGRVSAGAASLYAHPNDAKNFAERISELLDNPGKRQEMGEYGKARVENLLSWQKQVPALLNAYQALLDG